MRTTLVVAILALAFVGNSFGAGYSKRTLSDARLGTDKNELIAQMKYSGQQLQFFTNHHWMVAARHGNCWSHVPWAKTCNHARIARRLHQRLLADAHTKYETLYNIVGHLDGWRCITNGAYPRAPHEGNGYNGQYTGPLGMTTPWLGYYPPGSDWVHSSVTAVYAIAERVAAANGFSYAFMSGQWPNTFPPCAHFFG